MFSVSARTLVLVCAQHCSLLQVLLKNSVNVLGLLDEQERTPLHIAAQAGNTDCVSVLLKYGAQVHTVQADPAEQSAPLASALHSAAASGSTDALKMILAAIGNSIVNSVDSFERTPLHVAASNAHVECVKVCSFVFCSWYICATLLLPTESVHMASLTCATMLQVLLEAGANVHARNSWGATALHLAARKRSPAVMHLLLKGGASIDAADNHSMSALHYSAQTSCLPSMQLLLANEASVNVLSSLSETPLSLAAHASSSNSNSVEAISMLLTAGASLSCLNKMFPDLNPAAQALLQAHVRRTSIATAASMRAISAQKLACGGSSLDLCGDIVHLILAKSLDVEDEFLRLLLNGRGEECCVLA